jgi:hypothetical protein
MNCHDAGVHLGALKEFLQGRIWLFLHPILQLSQTLPDEHGDATASMGLG